MSTNNRLKLKSLIPQEINGSLLWGWFLPVLDSMSVESVQPYDGKPKTLSLSRKRVLYGTRWKKAQNRLGSLGLEQVS